MEQRSRIASVLRGARENLGLSIEQAGSDAGVPIRYVRLLEGESGAGIGISDSLYLIPFFRRYANYLGLKAEELLPDFLGEVQEVPGAIPPARLSHRSRIALLWKPAAIAAAIALAVLLIRRQTPERPALEEEQWTEPEIPAQGEIAGAEAAPNPPSPGAAPDADAPPGASADVAGPLAAAVQPGVAAAAGAQTASLSDPSAPAGAEPVPGGRSAPAVSPPGLVPAPEPGGAPAGHELRIVATEEAWLALGVDDEPTKSILLHPGESRTWTARTTFTLTLGNAGGVTVVLDGNVLPNVGKSGQVVRNLRLPQGGAPPSAG